MSFMDHAFCTGHWHVGTGLALVPVKENLNAYKNIADNCVLPSLWSQYGKVADMGVMARCPHSIGHMVYIKTQF